MYTDNTRTVKVALMQPAKNNGTLVVEKGKNVRPKPSEGNRLTAFVNPYSGEVAAICNHKNIFLFCYGFVQMDA